MHDNDLKRLVRTVSDGPAPTLGQVREVLDRVQAGRRRRTLAVVAGGMCVLAAIAAPISWRALAPSSQDDTTLREPSARESTADSSASPSASPGPTAKALCHAPAATDYTVNFPYGRQGEATADAAARPWLLNGEELIIHQTEDKSRQLVALGPTSGPREVLAVRHTSRGWLVEVNTACLSAETGPACGPDTLAFESRAYELVTDRPTGAEPGVGQVFGQAETTVCLQSGADVLRSRGVVRPVTAFQANEQDPSEAVVITRDGSPLLYADG